MTNVLEVRALTKEFPGVKALAGVDFTVLEGEVHCLLGPNGSGKSTLIKCVSGAYEPTSGEILFRGEPLPSGTPPRAAAASMHARTCAWITSRSSGSGCRLLS